MESTGQKDQIQATKATADLLIAAGKQHWVQIRKDQVNAKGLGLITTYWITPWDFKAGTSRTSSSAETADIQCTPTNDKSAPKEKMAHKRLVDWMSEMFKTYIKDIAAKRSAPASRKPRSEVQKQRRDGIPLDEVVERIILPEFNANTKALASLAKDGRDVVLDDEICSLIHEYISIIASLYRSNPFHNFGTKFHE